MSYNASNPRFVVKFVNGAWTTFDRHFFKNIALHDSRKAALHYVERRLPQA